MDPGVLVIIGSGGMGAAIGRRVGAGSTIVVSDISELTIESACTELRNQGHEVVSTIVDVSSRASVRALAELATSFGPVTRVAHTAGLSPVQASVQAILAVDLLGVALVLDEFGSVVAPGGAGVVISSMAGYSAAPLPDQDGFQLATAPADDLLALPCCELVRFANSGEAYGFAKRANQLRVQAASGPWGARGARINSISPGIIATTMGRAELDGPSGVFMRAMVDASPAKRLGSADEIAAAAEFLLGPSASFVTGVDILVDGGVTAALRTGQIDMSALLGSSSAENA